ncbi:COG1361 family protein [Kitasatospora griseola]|uniref:peptidase n=1 Tax=Kitasatospora griseola TaxID=2064 RepID=UPI003807FA0D
MRGARRSWAVLAVLAAVYAVGVGPATADGMPGGPSAAPGVTEHEGHEHEGHEAPSPEPSPTAQTIGIKLLDAPEDRREDPRAQAYIVDHLAPGSTIERRVEVINETSAPMHVDIYAAAASIVKGQFAFAADRAANELTGWTSLDASGLDLAAHGAAKVRATITVPKDAAAGERYGVVWAQTGSDADPKHNLAITGRVGVRMYLDVGPGGEPASDFEIEQLSPARGRDGRAELHARIHNTGGRALDINGALSLSDGPGGLRAGPFTAKTGTTLAPGDRAEAVVPLDSRLPDGPWNVELTLRSGLVEHTARAAATFPTTPGGAGAVTASAAQSESYPTPVAAGLSALVLAAGGFLFLRFHRRQRR